MAILYEKPRKVAPSRHGKGPFHCPFLPVRRPMRNRHRLGVEVRRTTLVTSTWSQNPPDVVLVCPATFNTVSRLALGIADTYTASALAEALGVGVPMFVVPMVNDRATRPGLAISRLSRRPA
jgi:hypothetical protein